MTNSIQEKQKLIFHTANAWGIMVMCVYILFIPAFILADVIRRAIRH